MLAARTTLAHFSVSSAMSMPKSEDEPGNAAAPRSANRAFNLGSTRPALISLLSLSTMSAGVFFGAPRPVQKVASKPSTKSPTVGMSGSASERVATHAFRKLVSHLPFSRTIYLRPAEFHALSDGDALHRHIEEPRRPLAGPARRLQSCPFI